MYHCQLLGCNHRMSWNLYVLLPSATIQRSANLTGPVVLGDLSQRSDDGHWRVPFLPLRESTWRHRSSRVHRLIRGTSAIYRVTASTGRFVRNNRQCYVRFHRAEPHLSISWETVSYSSVLDLSVSAKQQELYQKQNLDVERWTELGQFALNATTWRCLLKELF